MLTFKDARTKRRSRSYADLPINIANRKLPALPIHKRKLPALPQSASVFRDEPILDEDICTEEETMPSKVSLHTQQSAPFTISNYFKKKKHQKSPKTPSRKLYKPKSVPLKSGNFHHQKAKSDDDGKSIRDIFFNIVKMGGSKKTLHEQQHHRPKSARNHNVTSEQQSKSKWRPGLEFINNDNELLNELIGHCQRQCCEENIEFLHVVYDFNKRITRLLLSYDTTSVEEEAINIEIVSIYSTFIVEDAEKQINLSHDIFARAMEDFDTFRTCSLNQKSMIFDECVVEIERLMKKSVLSQFYQSDGFQSIAMNRGIMENKKFIPHCQQLDHSTFDMMSIGSDEPEEGYFSDSQMSNYSALTCSSYGGDYKQNECVHFDIYSRVKWNDHNKWMLSSKGMSEGCYEWKIEILKSNEERQEFGVISAFDENMEVNEYGICETPQMCARAVYGFQKLDKMNKNKKIIGSEHHFYYASYNADNSVRCNKDLSKLALHENKWREGDVIRISLDMDKGVIKFYLNDKKVRKAVSVDKNATFYPIILYSGNCEYRLID